MPSYKLTYLNGKARAENIRYLLVLAGKQFEDQRIDYEKDWKAQKANFEYGQVPVFEIDGKKYHQSHAIWRYLAKEFGYYGSSNEEALRIDMVCELADELLPFYFKKYYWTPEDQKVQAMEEYETKDAERVTGHLEKLLKQNNGGAGWFIGDKMTLADVMVFNVIHDIIPWLLEIKEGEYKLKDKDALKGFIQRFKAIDSIAAYMKKRPVTDF